MNMINGERAFTLIELVIALGVTALITGVLGTAIFQIYDRSARNQDVVRALNDIHNGGRWLYLDGERAETTNLIEAASPVNTMNLTWTADGQPHTTTYSLSGTELIRDHNGTIITVARYVSSVEFSMSNRLIKIDLTSAPGNSGVTKQVTYQVWLRPAN